MTTASLLPAELGGRVASHLQHIKHQVAGRVRIGDRIYAMRGYVPFRFGGDWAHEPHMLRALRELLRDRPGAFIDVGASFGQTLAMLLDIDPERRYIGFEPQVSCCHYIEQFIRDNALARMQILPVALSDRNGLAPFHVSHPGDMLGSLHAGHHAEQQSDEATLVSYVGTRVGDEVMGELGAGPVAMIKIDAEGAEHLVLRGLVGTVATQRPVVVLEFLPNFIGNGTERTMLPAEVCAQHRARAAEIEALFEQQRYALHVVDEAGGELRRVARLALDDPAQYVSYNYAAVPLA
jgi:FkbM family methyltransferase